MFFYINFQSIDQSLVLSNQIAGLADHQYLWHKTINVLNLLNSDCYQEKIDTIALVWAGVCVWLDNGCFCLTY